MLAARLLLFKRVGERIVPVFLGEHDHPWLQALLDERERFVGRPHRDLREHAKELLAPPAPPRKRALAAHVLEQLAVPVRAARPTPRVLRAAVFTEAGTASSDRAATLAVVAGRFGLTPDELEPRLFEELADERPVAPLAAAVSPVELAARANLATARGLVARADRVTLELLGNALPIVRRAKLRGLIVEVVGGRERAETRLEVSGPLAIFHHTTVYGRRLGELVGLLAWCGSFRLEAHCTLADGPGILQLRSGAPIFPAAAPRRFDSAVEEDFARRFGRLTAAWELVRDPEPLRAGDRLVFPDFAIVPRGEPERRWWLEIVGYWTPEYLARKVDVYGAAGIERLILCVDERLGDGLDKVPAHAIVRYKRRIEPRSILAILEAHRVQPRGSREPAGSAPTDARMEESVYERRQTALLARATVSGDENLLSAVRQVAARSPYGNAFVSSVARELGRPVALSELLGLVRAGQLALNRPTADFTVRPLSPRRLPLSVDEAVVIGEVARVVAAAGHRTGDGAVYHLVREWFDWLGPEGEDVLLGVMRGLHEQGRVRLIERGRLLWVHVPPGDLHRHNTSTGRVVSVGPKGVASGAALSTTP